MSYSIDLRTRVVAYARAGGNQTEAARLFKVSRKTVYLWLQRGDALADLPRKPYVSKLDKAELAAHVRDYPDQLLRERAAVFGVKPHTIYTALKQQGISYKKTTRYSEARPEQRIDYLQRLRAWVSAHGSKNIVYVDESGFVAASHRPCGWAKRGVRVHGKVPGKRQKKTNLIMAQRKKDWLAPMLFTSTCTHHTVNAWIEQVLIPALEPNSIVIMDNAPFHNKKHIAAMLEEKGHSFLPLPPYSPDFNPIEHAFANIKRQLQNNTTTLEQILSG